MDDLAFEKKSHRRQIDMRMGPNVDSLIGQEFRRTHLVEEDERPDHLTLQRRQRPAHLHLAEIDGPRHDDHFDGVDALGVTGNGIGTRSPSHDRSFLGGSMPLRRPTVGLVRMKRLSGHRQGCDMHASSPVPHGRLPALGTCHTKFVRSLRDDEFKHAWAPRGLSYGTNRIRRKALPIRDAFPSPSARRRRSARS